MGKRRRQPGEFDGHIANLVRPPFRKYRLSAHTIGYQQGDMALTPEGIYIYARIQGAEYKGEAHTLEFGAIRGNDGYVTDAPTPRLATLEFFLAGGDLTVGFKTENTNCNWACVDNFNLEYLGMEEGGLARQLSQTITEAQNLKKDMMKTKSNTRQPTKKGSTRHSAWHNKQPKHQM